MREDRNMELSTRGRRESDGEGVRTKGKTEKETEWWGSKERKEQRGWKWKRKDSRQNLLQWIELHADLWAVLGIIIHQPEWMGRLNQSDASEVVCVCLCMYWGTLILTRLVCPQKQTDFCLEQKQAACSEETSTRLPLFHRLPRRDVWTTQDRVVEAFLWCGTGICAVHGYNHGENSRQTQFYCLLCGIIIPCHWSGGMLKKTKTKNERKAATYCARQSETETLEPYGHPEGGETCPV